MRWNGKQRNRDIVNGWYYIFNEAINAGTARIRMPLNQKQNHWHLLGATMIPSSSFPFSLGLFFLIIPYFYTFFLIQFMLNKQENIHCICNYCIRTTLFILVLY